MKKFVEASIEEIELNETAYGPDNDKEPDSEKVAIFDANGKLIGWRRTFGENHSSAQAN